MKNCHILVGLIALMTTVWAHDDVVGWAKVESVSKHAVGLLTTVKRQFNYSRPWATPQYKEASGTAFFFDLHNYVELDGNDEGYLLTNYHVVKDAHLVMLQLPGGSKKKVPVVIVGVCPERDLALLRLTPKGLETFYKELNLTTIPALKLGDSDLMIKRGQPVYTLGFPLGQQSLKGTTGVVSGSQMLEDGQTYIQIDAPINPGNSGGPLLDENGLVIAVNTAGIPSAQNIGFGIPINEAKCLFKDLLHKKIVAKPELGIYPNHATDYQAEYLGNPVPSGLYIYFVVPGSIADKAGIQPGDMLYEFNGYTIDEYGDTYGPWSDEKISIKEITARLQEGDNVSFLVWRSGKSLELQAVCEEPPAYARSEKYVVGDCEVLGGATFMDLVKNHYKDLPKNPFLIQYMLPENQNEPVVIVSDVIPGTEIAEVGGIYPGTILKEVNEQPVKTLEDVRQALLLSVKSGSVALKTSNNMFIVFSLKKLLENQQELAQERICPITPVVGKLLKDYMHEN